MGMNVGTGSGKDAEVMVEINTTPLIDVMLVLLIMLIITLPMQYHAIKLNNPIGNPPPPPKPPVVVKVMIDFDGTILWDGQTVPDQATLASKMESIARMDDQPELHLQPDALTKYKYVAKVLATAQRSGVVKIGIIGNDKYAK